MHRKRSAGLGALVLAAVFAIVGVLLLATRVGGEVAVAGFMSFGFGVGSLYAAIASLRTVKGRAKQDQRAYYAVTSLSPLSPEQRAALRLDAYNSFEHATWGETLEMWPCERRLADADRAEETFDAFPLSTRDESLRSLNSDWGVISPDGYRKMVARLFEGMHSREFREAFGEDAANSGEFKTRLAELVGIQPKMVDARLHPTSHGPPQLVWAFDLWRVIPMARNAYSGGLISENEAWADILKASSWLRALFASLEDYYANLRLGHAFWSMDFDSVLARRNMIEAFETDEEYNWPIRDVRWDTQGPANLPEYVRDGLTSAVAQDIRVRDGGASGEIGFSLPT